MSGLNLRGSLSGEHMRGSNSGTQEPYAVEIAKELDILLKDSQPRYETNDREREYLIYRSGSAPPTVEGSLASVGGLFSHSNLNSAPGSDFGNNGKIGGLIPEEELRNCYYSHVNRNPRLLSREDWRSAHRLQAVSGYGGIGDRRRLKSLDDENSRSLFSSQPVLSTDKEEGLEMPLETHMQQSHGSLFGQSSTDWVEGRADGLIGLSSGRLGSRPKNFVDLLQEDLGMPKPVYTSRSHSRPASRAAYDEVGDRVRVTEAQLANLCNTSIYPLSGLDMALVEGMRSHSAAPRLTRVQSLPPQSSHAFSSAESASISRNHTPDPHFVGGRSVSPCPPMMGGRLGKADKQNIAFTDTYNVVSSSINETEELSAALSHLNMSSNRTVDMEENHQNMEHQNHHLHLISPQNENHQYSKIEDQLQETQAEFLRTPVFTEHFQESYVDLDQDNRGIGDVKILSDSSISQIEGGPMQQRSRSFTPNCYAAAGGCTSDFKGSTGHYQNAHLTNVCIPNYGMDGYPINPVFPSMAGSYIDTNTLTDSFDNPATASAVGAVSMDSRSDINGVHGGRSGSTADLHNLYRLNGQVGDELQVPLFNPISIQCLQRMKEYNAQMAASFTDPSMAGSYMNGSYVDLLEMQKLLCTQPKSEYHMPYLEKNGTVNSGYFCNPSYHLALPYSSSSISSPVLPSSPVVHISPSFRQSERSSRISSNTSSVGGVVGLWRSENGSDIEKKYGSSLLEEFKTTKIRSFQLSEIVGHVLEFSADQYGSRFIQQKLETASLEEKNMVFQEIFPEALSLMTDVFGNYVIQKFFEHGTSKQRRGLANQLFGHVLVLSLQMYGCRVIQKAIEVVDVDQQEKLVVELDGYVMRCVRDQNGNHVIQKCIECIPQDRIEFIISSFFGQVVPLSTHPYGCRVIQRVLEHYTDERTQHTMMEEILQSACTLAQDQYGNYVVQHVLEHGKPHERGAVIKKLAGQIVKMSQQKFASNVVEKCLAFGGPVDRQILINEMLGSTDENEPLQAMMKDQYANYVVQKVLEICNDQQRELILSRIRVHLSALKKYTYGKHIVARVEKLVAAGEKRVGTRYMYLS